MEMTNEEIVRHYREAADKAADIQILADLNVTKRKEIIAILENAGEAIPGRYLTGSLMGKIKPLLEQGLSNKAIAERLGCSSSTVANCRKRNGIPTGRMAAGKETDPTDFTPEPIYTRIESIIASLPEGASEYARKTARELIVTLLRDDIDRRLELGGRNG